MSTSQRFAKDIGIIGVTNISLFLKGILLLPLITKLLGVQAYGVWAQLLVTLSLLTPIALLGMPASLVRFLAGNDDMQAQSRILSAMLLLVVASSVFVAFILTLFKDSLAVLLDIPAAFILLLAGITLFECINSLLFNMFRAMHQISGYAVFTLVQSFGEILFTVAAVLFGYGLWGAVFSLLLVRILVCALLLERLVRTFGIAKPDINHIQDYLRFGLPTVGSNLAYWVVTSSDRYVIGFFIGISAVGYYAPAYTFGNLLTIFIMPFSLVLPSILSRLFDQHDIASVEKYIEYSLKYFLLLALPGAVGLWALSHQLLVIFSTPDIADQGASIIPLVALSMVCYGMYSMLAQVFDLYKKTGISTMIWSGAAFLNVCSNLLLVPILGILGAGLSTLIVYIVALIVTWKLATRRIRITIDMSWLMRSITASVLMGILVALMEPQGMLEVLLASMIGVGIYGGALLLLGGITPKERAFFSSFFQNFRNAFIQP